ncbi:MAG: hypothetical protein JW717_08175 [Marinilabiliaceae bacterium]|nr:hypothetical protein [Marinilabiliaceae bacterium]
MMHKLVFFLFLIGYSTTYSQYYSTGEDPASIKWNQINTNKYKIVYDREFEIEAKKLAIILNESVKYIGSTLNHTPKKIKLIIHSKSATSNGSVIWAPKRIELYPKISPNNTGTNQLDQLAIHEYRHVVQMSMLNRGFTKVFSTIAGEQAIGAVTGMHFPLWYLEGDATLSETTLTNEGRGRLPFFEQGLRTQVLNGIIYTYDKAYFGSYKSYVPNYYELGYNLVSGARKYINNDIWNNIANRVARYSFYPFIFNSSIKKTTALNKKKLYQSVFDSLQHAWQMQDKKIQLTNFEKISKEENLYKSYVSPITIDSNSIITEIESPDYLKKIISINKNSEEYEIITTGTRNPDRISATNKYIAWSEYRPNVRWGNSSTSDIKYINLKTFKTHRITKKNTYFSPAISPNNKWIAAIKTNDNNKFSLDIFDLTSKKIVNSIQTGDTAILSPHWDSDSKQIVAILLTSNGKSIQLLNTNSKKWEMITPFFHEEIKNPIIHNNDIYFTGTWNGIDNIYKANTANRKIYQVTSDRFGADYANISENNELIYSHYTYNGYKLVKMPLCEALNKPLDSISNTSLSIYKDLINKEKGLPRYNFSAIDTIPTKKYSKWNLINFHSWSPIYANPYDFTYNKGIMFLSQNLLNTMILTAGYNGDNNYKTEKFYANISYRGWFPIIDFEFKCGIDQITSGYYSNASNAFYIKNDVNNWLYQISPKISVPLDITHNKFYRIIIPSFQYNFYHINKANYTRVDGSIIGNTFFESSNEYKEIIPSYNYHGLEYEIYFHNLLKKTQNSIISKWGQVFQFNYQHTPWGDKNNGSIFNIFTRLYTPGFGLHHGFRFDNSFQYKTDGDIISTNNNYEYRSHFNSYTSMPRGYAKDDQQQKIYSFKGDYILPLCNPDFAFGGIYYLKRIKLNLFFDYSLTQMHLYNTNTKETDYFNHLYQSIGSEWSFEGHAFRFVFPIDLGIRHAYLPKEQTNYFEFLFSINIK